MKYFGILAVWGLSGFVAATKFAKDVLGSSLFEFHHNEAPSAYIEDLYVASCLKSRLQDIADEVTDHGYEYITNKRQDAEIWLLISSTSDQLDHWQSQGTCSSYEYFFPQRRLGNSLVDMVLHGQDSLSRKSTSHGLEVVFHAKYHGQSIPISNARHLLTKHSMGSEISSIKTFLTMKTTDSTVAESSKTISWNRGVAQASAASCDFDRDMKTVDTGRSSLRLHWKGDARRSIGCLSQAALILATSPHVSHVSIETEFHALNYDAAWIVMTDKEDYYRYWYPGINGTGQIVGVADTGLDQQSCYFRDDVNGETPTSTVGAPTVFLNRRKVVQYIAYADGEDEYQGHGTHVCGSVGGYRTSTGPEQQYNGLAFGSKLTFFDIGSGTAFGAPTDLSGTVFTIAHDAGAMIHSNSWGSTTTPSAYTNQDRHTDDFTFNNKDFMILYAAGNCGQQGDLSCSSSGGDSLVSPSTSKNGVAVGATENDGTGFNEEHIAYFSSQGPAYGGRIKPDVVAPGYFVYSASASDPSATGSHEQSCESIGSAGTSMATPVVAGASALIRDYFAQGYYPSGEQIPADSVDLDGVLLKALLVQCAQGVAAYEDEFEDVTVLGSTPDYYQGHGRVNIENVLQFNREFNLLARVDHCDPSSPTQFFNYSLVATGTRALSATMAWMDPPSVVNAVSPMIHDLDLKFIKGGSVYYPNGDNFPDTANNVEKIINNNVLNTERYDVIVSCTDVTDLSGQDFAIVVTGDFVWLQDTYNYGGVSYVNDDYSDNTGFWDDVIDDSYVVDKYRNQAEAFWGDFSKWVGQVTSTTEGLIGFVGVCILIAAMLFFCCCRCSSPPERPQMYRDSSERLRRALSSNRLDRGASFMRTASFREPDTNRHQTTTIVIQAPPQQQQQQLLQLQQQTVQQQQMQMQNPSYSSQQYNDAIQPQLTTLDPMQMLAIQQQYGPEAAAAIISAASGYSGGGSNQQQAGARLAAAEQEMIRRSMISSLQSSTTPVNPNQDNRFSQGFGSNYTRNNVA